MTQHLKKIKPAHVIIALVAIGAGYWWWNEQEKKKKAIQKPVVVPQAPSTPTA